jgi:hypothetical protein
MYVQYRIELPDRTGGDRRSIIVDVNVLVGIPCQWSKENVSDALIQ